MARQCRRAVAGAFEKLGEHEKVAQCGEQRVVGAMAALVCVAIVAVPVSLALTSTGSGNPPGVKLGTSGAKNRVLSALSSTIASGSFNMTYDFGPMTGTAANASTNPTVSVATALSERAGPHAEVEARSKRWRIRTSGSRGARSSR